jgi:hypothetical protein
MLRSSDRGQTFPLAALAALLVVCVALSAYAGALDAAVPPAAERDRSTPALLRVLGEVRPGAVALPGRLGETDHPAGVRVNVTLRAGGRAWHAGPVPPRDAPPGGATRRLPVRVETDNVSSGRLRVVAWQ